jgi:hypothetical protein
MKRDDEIDENNEINEKILKKSDVVSKSCGE